MRAGSKYSAEPQTAVMACLASDTGNAGAMLDRVLMIPDAADLNRAFGGTSELLICGSGLFGRKRYFSFGEKGLRWFGQSVYFV